MDIQKLINDYAEWLKQEIKFTQIGEYYELSTPYLNNSNDYIQIYVRQDQNDIYLTDDGATLNDLKMSGLTFTSNRKKQLNRILTQYGVQFDGKAITCKGPISSFPQKKHMLVQAMLSVNDMLMITRSKVSSFFLDDLQHFFDDEEIFYTENVTFTGRSGFSHAYDFVLQRTKKNSERLCKAVNNANKSNMMNILFSWDDTKSVRRADSKLIVFINDNNNLNHGVEDGFNNYGAKVILWSERKSKDNLELLSA